ncbi:MAG: dTDP-glucose 4,6-dehydratase [Methylophilaceae bacterium]|nr:dTDP-glucose 4,6-dehydratase [Methylophilaceae bacterium]
MNNKNIYHPKNILVTGGAGFIGSNFIHYILSNNKNIKIVNLDSLTYAGNLDNLNGLPDINRYKFIKGDICDLELIKILLRDNQIDTIVHFAAESHVDRSIVGPNIFVKTNIEGTAILLEEARIFWQEDMSWTEKDCRFHQISTDEVYGSLGEADQAFTEKSPYDPSSPYSASKAGADYLVRAYFRTFNLPVTISCCSNNYGPLQHQEKLIPTVIRSCINSEPIPVYGDGSNIRDWLFVIDHCSAVNSILSKGKVGHTYNIGGDNELSNINLILQICYLLDELIPSGLDGGYKSLISHIHDRLGHDWRYAINADKLKNETGWSPNSRFDEMLLKTIKMYAGISPMKSEAII